MTPPDGTGVATIPNPPRGNVPIGGQLCRPGKFRAVLVRMALPPGQVPAAFDRHSRMPVVQRIRSARQYRPFLICAWFVCTPVFGLRPEMQLGHRQGARTADAHQVEPEPDATRLELPRFVAPRPDILTMRPGGLVWATTQETSKDASTGAPKTGDGFRVHTSPHFVLVTDVSRRHANRHLVRFEQTHHAFERFCRRCSIGLTDADKPMRILLFEERDAFLTYAREHDGIDASWSLGYANPADGRAVLAHDDDVARNHGTGMNALAATVHETTHLIATARGFLHADIDAPLWVPEGLATSFETDDVNQAFGPRYPFAAREDRVRVIVEQDLFSSFNDFLTRRRLPTDPRDRAIYYAECYAFFSWIADRRAAQLATYIDALNTHAESGNDALSADEHHDLIETSFGSIPSLERQWKHALRERAASKSS